MLGVVTSETFESEVLGSEVPVLLDFYADWCGPCKAQVPALEAVAGQYEGRARIMKLNVDDSQEIAVKFGVQSIPTLILFKDGEAAERLVGKQSEQTLSAALDKVT